MKDPLTLTLFITLAIFTQPLVAQDDAGRKKPVRDAIRKAIENRRGEKAAAKSPSGESTAKAETTAAGGEFQIAKDQVPVKKPDYSPYVDQHIPQRVLWGDCHHHTSLSVDSGLIGNRNDPHVSFRLARGEEVTSNSGQRVKLIRPLDFLVVTDHAEYLGIAKLLNEANPDLLATDVGKEWYAQM